MFPKSLSFSLILAWASNTLKYISLKYNLTVAKFIQFVILSLFFISENKIKISPASKNKPPQFSSKCLLLSFHINISKCFTASMLHNYLFLTFWFPFSWIRSSHFLTIDPHIFSTELFHFFLIGFPAIEHTCAQLHVFYSCHTHILNLTIWLQL